MLSHDANGRFFTHPSDALQKYLLLSKPDKSPHVFSVKYAKCGKAEMLKGGKRKPEIMGKTNDHMKEDMNRDKKREFDFRHVLMSRRSSALTLSRQRGNAEPATVHGAASRSYEVNDEPCLL